MRKEYHKLVRDAIHELIHNQGGSYEIATLTEEQYQHALREKLVEEAYEAEIMGSVIKHIVCNS